MRAGTFEIKLGKDHYPMLHAAVRLRAEACVENGEKREAARWRKLLRNIELVKRLPSK